jgi:hypothetical protein
VHSENFVTERDGPVEERRLFEIGDAVEASGYPIAGDEHVARDLRLHGVNVVHERRRRNDATHIDRSGEK